MGAGGGDELMVSGSHEAGCPEATVEIKIKTLDSQTYTLKVDKCVPVPALKEHIASVTGVVSEQQRLICRGKVLKDDQLLSAYHVEDGHTLHLVVRQPIPSLSEALPDHSATNPASNTGNAQGGRGPSIVVGTFNISGQGNGNFPDFGRVMSAVQSSFGISTAGTVDLNSFRAALERLSRIPDASDAGDSSRELADQATAGNQSSPLGVAPQTANNLEHLQLPVIHDSLTTLSQYLNHLRNEFVSNGANRNNIQATPSHGSNVVEPDLTRHTFGQQSGLPGPSSLAEVMRSMRQLLIEQAVECLSYLARQLDDHGNVTDPSTRTAFHLNMLQSGVLLQNLGASLLELGRTTMMLRLGQTPADAVVNAGPAAFISSSGPNPIMVQPQPFQLGTRFGAFPIGTTQPGSSSGGSLSSESIPRNIDIRIRRGSSVTVNHMEQSGPNPSQPQINPALSGVTNSFNQAAAGTSGIPSSNTELEVRVLPVRTVVATIPSIRPASSGPSRRSVGLVLPVLARVQHLSLGNINTAGGSQPSTEHNPNGSDAESLSIPEFARQEQNTGFSAREGNNPSGSGTQNSGGFLDSHSRFGQILRSTYEQLDVARGNSPSAAHSSVAVPSEIAEATANTEEASPRVSTEGALLSNVLRQIMPLISQNTVGSGGPSSEDTTNRQALRRQELDSDAGTSSPHAETSSPPNAKRQKVIYVFWLLPVQRE